MVEETKHVRVGFGIMVVRAGKVLLGKRGEDPAKADTELHLEGTWTMPGGKLEYGESFEEGAKRELAEETGMTLSKMRILCVNNDMNEHAHFITIGFLAKTFSGEPKVMEPDEITDWKWFELHQLPHNMYSPSKKIIECYQKGVFSIEQ